MATLEETFAKRQNESAGQINNLYDKQNAAQAASLKADYDRSLSDAQAAAKNIQPQYRAQANALAGQYERQRRNANLNAMTSGLANGSGQQQQNALRNQYVANYGALMGQEAGAVNAANQNIANLTAAYNNALAKSRADIEARRDQSLIEAYNQNQTRRDNQAAALANYGNFDAYRQMYGDAQANQMRNVWISKNPEVAFRAGMITSDEYQKLTNKAATLGYSSIYD